jgi:tyrosinase
MSDLFNSVNDPLFWVHHSGIDRVWSLWQEKDPKRVMDAGTPTGWFDMTPLKLESWVWVGFAGQDRKVVEVMDPLNRDGRGVLCYKYEGEGFDSYFA